MHDLNQARARLEAQLAELAHRLTRIERDLAELPFAMPMAFHGSWMAG